MKKILMICAVALIVLAGAWKIFNLNMIEGKNSSDEMISDKEFRYAFNSSTSADKYITTMKEELVENPGNSNLLTKLGAAYIQKARESNDPEYYSDAEKVLKFALESDPENFLAMAELGSVNLSRHNFKEALELGQKALQINPYSSYTHGVIVDAQVELGLYDEAVASLQKMVDQRPDLSSFSRVSYLRELHGDMTGAIDAMKSAILAGAPTAENTTWCEVQLANLYYNSGNVSESEKIFDRITKNFPEYVHGYAGLGKVKMFNKDYPGAIELYKKALQKNSLPEYHIALGDAYTLAGEMDKAEEQYQKVKFIITMFGENGVDTDLELALFNADHNRYLKESLEDSESAIEDGSKSIKAFHTLAWINYKLGNFSDAEKNIREALKLGTQDPLLNYHAGKIFEKTGDTERSKKHLNLALSIYPYFENLYSE